MYKPTGLICSLLIILFQCSVAPKKVHRPLVFENDSFFTIDSNIVYFKDSCFLKLEGSFFRDFRNLYYKINYSPYKNIYFFPILDTSTGPKHQYMGECDTMQCVFVDKQKGSIVSSQKLPIGLLMNITSIYKSQFKDWNNDGLLDFGSLKWILDSSKTEKFEHFVYSIKDDYVFLNLELGKCFERDLSNIIDMTLIKLECDQSSNNESKPKIRLKQLEAQTRVNTKGE